MRLQGVGSTLALVRQVSGPLPKAVLIHIGALQSWRGCKEDKAWKIFQTISDYYA